MQAATYSVKETLRDGNRIEIRALKPTDRDELLGTMSRMSDESIRRRFFAPKRHFTEREIDYYLNVDFVDHVALVGVLNADGQTPIVGGCRYIVTEPGVAEIAFAVDDKHQGRGIGGLLMKHLAAIARESGLHQLTAEVLPSNAPMLAVFEKAALEATTRRVGDVVHVTLRLT